MKNQLYTGTPTSRRFVKLPTTVKAGDALLVGKDPCFALDDYQSVSGGATCLFNGSFNATVVAKSALSPGTNAAINPGDPIYADGGTLDSTTNVTTGFTLDANSSTGVAFGHLDDTGPGIASGSTATAGVKI